jgi:hypothetical protein
VSFDSKQHFDRQFQIVDRLLITNQSSIEHPLASPPPVLKELIEPLRPPPLTVITKEIIESPTTPTEQTIREEGETWTNEEGNKNNINN